MQGRLFASRQRSSISTILHSTILSSTRIQNLSKIRGSILDSATKLPFSARVMRPIISFAEPPWVHSMFLITSDIFLFLNVVTVSRSEQLDTVKISFNQRSSTLARRYRNTRTMITFSIWRECGTLIREMLSRSTLLVSATKIWNQKTSKRPFMMRSWLSANLEVSVANFLLWDQSWSLYRTSSWELWILHSIESWLFWK